MFCVLLGNKQKYLTLTFIDINLILTVLTEQTRVLLLFMKYA